MTEIEIRTETMRQTPDYSGRQFSEREIERGFHRQFVGGKWDTHGQHQLEFLKRHGLESSHRFLDVGCGSLRAGRHLIDYLDSGNYYGIDANVDLIRAGYDVELSEDQRRRQPVANLRANDRFDGDFGVLFDMAIAQSVFTHVSLNHIRLCLYRVAKVMRPGGKFFVTFNEQRREVPPDTIISRKTGTEHLNERNIFWYYRSDIRWASRFAPWQFEYIGKWGHPGGQRMIVLTRLPD